MYTFNRSFVAGMAIALAATVYLQCPSRIVGAFLFSIGLLSVMSFRLKLYTGYTGLFACAIDPDAPVDIKWYDKTFYLADILIGNICGALVLGFWAGFIPECREAAVAVMQHKTEADIVSMFVKAVLCGALMQIAFIANSKREQDGGIKGVGCVMAVMCIMAFILASFEHSIADFAYTFIAWDFSRKAWLLLGLAVLGNLFGGHFTIMSLSR